ncbi:MAG TPA: hypothetical protein VL882_22815 [Vicinamibacterales bacterium]|jgi:hypothetical protein|nr:hypothetical protein [Vicinamibacterales bacterium]
MRAISIALVVSLFTLTAGHAFAQEAQQWRKVADAIPLGSKVKIQTLEGKRVSGTLMRVDDTGVAVKKNTRLPEAAVAVTYDAIANIERDHGGGMNLGKAIGFGLAAGASAIATIFVIALQFD